MSEARGSSEDQRHPYPHFDHLISPNAIPKATTTAASPVQIQRCGLFQNVGGGGGFGKGFVGRMGSVGLFDMSSPFSRGESAWGRRLVVQPDELEGSFKGLADSSFLEGASISSGTCSSIEIRGRLRSLDVGGSSSLLIGPHG